MGVWRGAHTSSFGVLVALVNCSIISGLCKGVGERLSGGSASGVVVVVVTVAVVVVGNCGGSSCGDVLAG